jgi:hypothetical protein
MIPRSLALLFALGCGGDTDDAPTDTVDTVDTGEFVGCGATLCGCWEPLSFEFEGTVADTDGAPLDTALLHCKGQADPIAMADASGVVSFVLDTQVSPGCGLEVCNMLEVSAPGFLPIELATQTANGTVMVLQSASD